MKKYIFFLLAFLSIIPLNAIELNYEDFTSIEDVIAYETLCISRVDPSDYVSLADLYISRGESYLTNSEYEFALENFQKGYELSQYCSHGQKLSFQFRSLFGISLIYGYLDKVEEFYIVAELLQNVLVNLDCNAGVKTSELSSIAHHTIAPYQPIMGPEHLSVRDCIECVEGTVTKARYLISFVKKPEVQIILHMMVDGLRDKALNCCRDGGLWKTCLQPLVNRWHQWNEKYKMFGIPPDPAWD